MGPTNPAFLPISPPASSVDLSPRTSYQVTPPLHPHSSSPIHPPTPPHSPPAMIIHSDVLASENREMIPPDIPIHAHTSSRNRIYLFNAINSLISISNIVTSTMYTHALITERHMSSSEETQNQNMDVYDGFIWGACNIVRVAAVMYPAAIPRRFFCDLFEPFLHNLPSSNDIHPHSQTMMLILGANYLIFTGSIVCFLCLNYSSSDHRRDETLITGIPINNPEIRFIDPLSIRQGTPLDRDSILQGRPVSTQTTRHHRPGLSPVVIGQIQDPYLPPGSVNPDEQNIS